MSISKFLYVQVRQRAQFRCEYCHYPELLSSAPLSIDHLQPQSLGGTDCLDNLALACRRCNERRYNFTTGIDPETGTETSLFNPRQQNWFEHFIVIVPEIADYEVRSSAQLQPAIAYGISFR